jgi:hypothetical protein
MLTPIVKILQLLNHKQAWLGWQGRENISVFICSQNNNILLFMEKKICCEKITIS